MVPVSGQIRPAGAIPTPVLHPVDDGHLAVGPMCRAATIPAMVEACEQAGQRAERLAHRRPITASTEPARLAGRPGRRGSLPPVCPSRPDAGRTWGVARFLSADWFAEIARSAPPEPGVAPAASGTGPAQRADAAHPIDPAQLRSPGSPPRLVLEQVVHDTPDGEVRYRVIVTGRTAHIEAAPREANGATSAPDLIIASDWATASALAQGRLSAQAALMAGRLRIQGSLGRLSGWMSRLAGLDPVPADVRRRTTY
jgi:hypothetical protein